MDQDGRRQSHAIPAAFRPGRLNHLEILERLFPYHKKAVLELVLQGCNSDLIKAIEHFLSAQDTIVAQQQMTFRQPFPVENGPNGMPPGLNAYLMYPGMRPPPHFQTPPSLATTKESTKSAFTPLPPGYFGNLHSAFRPSGNQENILRTKELSNENPLVPPNGSHPYHLFQNSQFSPQMSSALPPHFMMHPFRPWTISTSAQELSTAVSTGRIVDKNSDNGRQTD